MTYPEKHFCSPHCHARQAEKSSTAIRTLIGLDMCPTCLRGMTPEARQTLARSAAAEFGRLGGAATAGISTAAKRRASRANGRRGGRPKIEL